MTEGCPALLGSQGRHRHPSETTTGLVLTQRCFRRRQQGGIALQREGFRALIPCQPGRCRWTPGGRQTLPLQQSAVSQRHTQQLRGPIAGTSRFTDDPGLINLLHEAFTIHRGRQGRPIRAPQHQPPANPCWNTTTNPRLQAKDRQQVSLWSITQQPQPVVACAVSRCGETTQRSTIHAFAQKRLLSHQLPSRRPRTGQRFGPGRQIDGCHPAHDADSALACLRLTGGGGISCAVSSS